MTTLHQLTTQASTATERATWVIRSAKPERRCVEDGVVLRQDERVAASYAIEDYPT